MFLTYSLLVFAVGGNYEESSLPVFRIEERCIVVSFDLILSAYSDFKFQSGHCFANSLMVLLLPQNDFLLSVVGIGIGVLSAVVIDMNISTVYIGICIWCP